MPIVATPPELKGTAQEDIDSRRHKGSYLRYFSDLFDEVTEVIKNGSMLNGKYDIIEEETAVTIKKIKMMTEESIKGKVFYIFSFPFIVAFSTKRVDIDYVASQARIIIFEGRRYLVEDKKAERLESTEFMDFNFIKIKRTEVQDLIKKSELIEKL